MTRRRSPRFHPQIQTSEEAAGMALRRSPRLHPQIHTSVDGSGIALRRSPRLHPQIPVSGKGAGMALRRSSRLNPQIRVGDEGAGMALRRSSRLNPQIRVGDEGAGVTRRRSPRLNPQVHSSEDGAGRRTTRLRPKVHASEEGSGITRRRRRGGTSPGTPVSLPDDDDMLREILMRLPPQPSSLPRASAVCKRWRRVTTDPRFLRSFSAHHRKPPLLGFFELDFFDIVFTSIMDPPDRIHSERFHALRQIRGFSKAELRKAELLACRHGRVLLRATHWFIVWDPITSELHLIHIPLAFEDLSTFIYGAVLCAAADQGHMHSSCHSSPFNLVLMSPCQGYKDGTPPIACVYSSETGLWGNSISTTDRCTFMRCNPGVLVGNVLYWSYKSWIPEANYLNLDDLTDDIIEFDLDKQSLAVIKGPEGLNYSTTHHIIQAEDGALGLAILSHGRFEMWQRKVSYHGGATWFLQKTIDIDSILGLHSQVEGSMRMVAILGYDEDNGVLFLVVGANAYMVQLMSMQSRKLYQSRYPNNHHPLTSFHPFTSFYAPGVAIPGGCDGAEMLQDM